MKVKNFRTKKIMLAYSRLREPKRPEEHELLRLESELAEQIPPELKGKLIRYSDLYGSMFENERRTYFQRGWMAAKKETS